MSEQETTHLHYMWTFFVMEEFFCDLIIEEANKKNIDVKATKFIKKKIFEMRTAFQRQYGVKDHGAELKQLIRIEVPMDTIMETFKF